MNNIQEKGVKLIEMLDSISQATKCAYGNEIRFSINNINYENNTHFINVVASFNELMTDTKTKVFKDFLISELTIRKTEIEINESIKLNIAIIDKNRTEQIEVNFKI